MFRRIKLLTMLQLSDRIKFKKSESIKGTFAKIGLWILSLVLVTVICSALIYALCDLMSIPKVDELIVFVIFFLQLLSIISCTSGLLKTLYLGKDNQILLSYPAHHVEVFLSKILVFYIYELLKGVFLIFPLLLGFGIIYGMLTVWYVLLAILMVFLLSLLPVLIGALLTMPILFINRLLNKFIVVKGALAVAALAGLFYLVYKVMSLIPVPLRIVALYNSFVMKFIGFLTSVNKYALFYNNIGDIMTNKNLGINLLIVMGILVGLILLVALLSMPLYFNLASRSHEHSNVKKHKGENSAHKNVFFTFVKKEWLLSIRNLGDFISNYSFMFAAPYVGYILVSIFSAIDRNDLGHHMTIVFASFIILVLASASNTSSAMAITKEGSEFVLLKTVPSDASKMAWAKIFFNLLFSSIMIIISFLVIALFCDRLENLTSLWMMLVTVLIINVGLVFWSFQIDIMNPNLREYASNGDSSSVKNESLSIMVGLIMSTIFVILTLLILMDKNGSFAWNWFRIIGLSLAFLVTRTYLFVSYLKNVFPDIEY